MLAPSKPDGSPTSAADLLEHFELAWQSDPPARLEEHVPPPGDPLRRGALIDLVHIDLEYRWKAGSGLPVEDYLRRFPELSDDPALVVELAAWEHELRCRTEPDLAPGELVRRFPQLGRELEERLGGSPMVRTSRPAGSKPPPLPQVPGYEVLEVLGQGGMGVVYRARHRGLDRLVAIKLIRADLSLLPLALARFEAEARAIARLDHPAIVRVHDSGVHQGQPFYVMEHVAGGTLAEALARGPLAPERAAALVARLTDGVQHAHEAGIVHRDLKPANVLLAACGFTESARPQAAEWIPKIADFGLARQACAAGITVGGDCLGTPAYMAPEQANGRTDLLGPATDVHGLGAILYECLTGRPPYPGAGRDEALALARKGDLVPPRQVRPRIPAALERICLRALAAEPARRHSSAAALAADLRRFLRRRRLLPYLGVALAVGLLGAAGWWGSAPSRGPQAPVPQPNSAPAPAPLRVESVEVLGSIGNRTRWRKIREARAEVLPIPNGEQINVSVTLNRPAHVYIVYLDSAGEPVPLYPWNRGSDIVVRSLAALPPVDEPSLHVETPPGRQGWMLEGKSSLDTVLVLADPRPLDEARRLDRLLRPPPPTPLRTPGELVVHSFARGRPVASEALSIDRGLTDTARRIDDDMLEMLGPLNQHFEIVHATRFAHKGE
jgi:serine/threonine-protein kinase